MLGGHDPYESSKAAAEIVLVRTLAHSIKTGLIWVRLLFVRAM